MKAVILAAGEGKRLRPFTETMPKVMLPVCNRPILEYIIDAIKKSGIDEIVLVVGYKKEVIMEHFKDYDGIEYVIQDKQIGTANALLKAKSHVKDEFIVVPGDNIIDQNSISSLISDKSKYSMLIKEHPNPSKYGVVFVEKQSLRRIVEKPDGEIGRFIATGIYKLSKAVFNKIETLSREGIHDLSSVIQSIVDDGEKINTIIAKFWADIVYPWDLISVNEMMLTSVHSLKGGTIEKGVTIKGDVSIGNDTKIHSGCYIVGPAIIGPGCEIGPNTCIFPSTVIGKNTVVGSFSEIRNSLIMDDTRIDSNSFISHSIVGRGVQIGNGFSNMTGEALIEIDDEIKKIEKIGVMIGEDTVIKNHVVVEPGVIIGRRCRIESMNRINKKIPSESKVM